MRIVTCEPQVVTMSIGHPSGAAHWRWRAVLLIKSWASLINALRNLESGPWALVAETSNANYFGTVWRREISLPRAHIIIISLAIYIFYSVINARVVSLSDTGFRKLPDFINSQRCGSVKGVLQFQVNFFLTSCSKVLFPITCIHDI